MQYFQPNYMKTFLSLLRDRSGSLEQVPRYQLHLVPLLEDFCGFEIDSYYEDTNAKHKNASHCKELT